jgi:hypothetical protein
VIYRGIVERLSKVDVVFIGMECEGSPLTWIYGPNLLQPFSDKRGEFRRFNGSDANRAWLAIEELQCSRVLVYAMGQDSWEASTRPVLHV